MDINIDARGPIKTCLRTLGKAIFFHSVHTVISFSLTVGKSKVTNMNVRNVSFKSIKNKITKTKLFGFSDIF